VTSLLAVLIAAALAQGKVAPPRVEVDVACPQVTSRTIRVAAADDFRAALEAARPGDEITLPAGAVFMGPFDGTGVSWIGYPDEWSGIADVPSLRAGSHTLTIQPTGRRRNVSDGAWIWVDGFSTR